MTEFVKDVLDGVGCVRLVDFMGGDLAISRSARVSYNAEWRAGDDKGSDKRLIRYLWNNKHTSPFESVVMTFEVKAPIFVLRQWHRHRTWSYNEVSARYTELPEEFYTPLRQDITEQHTDNKQMRTLVEHPKSDDIQEMLGHAGDEAFATYKELIKMGCPRELARTCLPVSTFSHMFGTVSLLNLFRFLSLRLHEHAQMEIRVYAQGMLELARHVAPEATAAFLHAQNVDTLLEAQRQQLLKMPDETIQALLIR